MVFLIGVFAWQSLAPPLPAPAPPFASSNSRPSPPPPAPSLPSQPSTPDSSPEEPLSLERRCLVLAETDPRQAVEFAIDSGLCDTNAGLLENLAAQWASRDFDAAHTWARQQEDGELRDALLARIAFAGAQSDPLAAAQIVSAEMASGPGQNEAALSVLHQWLLRDFKAAASWAATFPPGDLRTRAQAEIEGIRQSSSTSNTARP